MDFRQTKKNSKTDGVRSHSSIGVVISIKKALPHVEERLFKQSFN